jgi:putative radical SAM enzyme (TIGR03279 family)
MVMPRRHRYSPQPFPLRVTPETLAARAGVGDGDLLLAINDEPAGDFLDFFHQTAEEEFELTLRRADGSIYTVELLRSYGEPLGLTPSPEPLKDIVECENRCVFCFIHQQPKGLRRSLFIRDDDFRYSFTHGNFITLTNLTRADWERIWREQLSPLNVSVHSMSPSVRRRMIVHKRAGRIRQQLESLFSHGIQVHTQIVLCPGYNDGPDLDRTLAQLLDYAPHVLSVSIVPLGMTDYRVHLPQLPPVSPEMARQIMAQVRPWQEKAQQRLGDPLIRLGDEFYWLTGEPYPPFEHYGSFEQMEDGVGGARRMLDTFALHAHQLPTALRKKQRITVMTGLIGADIIAPLLTAAEAQVANLSFQLLPCPSRFWGPGITVSGLLTGQDLLAEAAQHTLGDQIWLPEVMVRNPERRFLDDLTLSEFERLVGRPVQAIPERAEDLIRAIRLLNRRGAVAAGKAVSRAG